MKSGPERGRQIKLSWNEGARTIEIENYANEPVRLNAVTESKSKKKD